MMDRSGPALLLHVDFETQALLTPGAIALHYAGATITYAELAQRAGRVASALSRHGIGAGCYVGLHVDRSIDYVASVLGILKANAAVVPLPPAHPRARLTGILEFAKLDAVVDHDDTPLAPVSGTRVLRFAGLVVETGNAATLAQGNPDQPAFVLASSGSTGKPKLIVRSHRSFYHRLCWTWANHPYGPDERCVQKSTMTTTHAIYELFEPLLRGVPTLVLGDSESRDLKGFWETINAWSITRLLVVPSALQVSMEFPGFAVPALKVVVLMGEYVHQRLAGRAIEVFPAHTSLYSIYGSTEASSTLVCDLRKSYRPNQELPLGRPISPDVQAYVLGEDLVPVGSGATGLLYFAGTALFTEYFRDPTLTASVFVRSPVTSDRLYDTHDQVRLTADGNIEYLGRTDLTVKVRGFRVDIQEVERTLLLHPSISHAAVVLDKSDAGEASLIGFYSPATVTRASVQSFMQEYLPPYMIPSILVGLEALPRTASGKTDRRRLLEDYIARSTSPATTGNLSPTEARVCEIWQAAVKHGDLQTDSNFFEVGGTSLTSFAAMHRLRAAFGLDTRQLTDQALYRYPTLQELAAFIDRLQGGAAPDAHADGNVLVQLRKGSDPSLPPLFFIASAGGTLGAYDKLVKALRTPRDVFGVRDPYVLGEREPTLSFQQWVSLYIAAMRQSHPDGPYFLVAYSSAGAFGYEIARRLRQDGQEVALLALVDPFGLDRPTSRSFGYRVMQARFRKAHFRTAVRIEGGLRAMLARFRAEARANPHQFDMMFTEAEFAQRVSESKRRRADVLGFSALLELNTGVPFTLTDAELAGLAPEQYFPAFVDRVRRVAPDLDPEVLDRIYRQYFGLQVPAQQQYRLGRYDGDVLLIELDGPSGGLLSAQLRPHVPRLRVSRIKVGRPTALNTALASALTGGLRDHYLCMRNDDFVSGLAAELETALL